MTVISEAFDGCRIGAFKHQFPIFVLFSDGCGEIIESILGSLVEGITTFPKMS